MPRQGYTMGRQGSLVSSSASMSSENAVALAHVDFDFANLQVEAPDEFKAIASAISPKQRVQAEGGALHRTTLIIGALFEGLFPPSKALIEAYGKRSSAIATLSRGQQQGSRLADMRNLAEFDVTSVWAAASSGHSAIHSHLLACFLARIWSPQEVTSIWVELLFERQQEIRQMLEIGDANPADMLKTQPRISREELKAWDSSVRSWLQTADRVMGQRQVKVMSIFADLDSSFANKRSTLHQTVIKSFTKALELVDNLVQGLPQASKSEELLMGMLAWHIYPDIFIAANDNVIIKQNDPLVKSTGILSLGLSVPSYGGAVWSLPLSELEHFDRTVTPSGPLDTASRISLNQLGFVIMGAIVGSWGDCPLWKDFDRTIGTSIIWFKRLFSYLAKAKDVDKFSLEAPNFIKSQFDRLGILYDACRLYTNRKSLMHKPTAEAIFHFGMRRYQSFWPANPQILLNVRAPFFGLSYLETMLGLLNDSEARIDLLRRVARRIRPGDTSLITKYYTGIEDRFEIASVFPGVRENDDAQGDTVPLQTRWICLSIAEFEALTNDSPNIELTSWLAKRTNQINSAGEICLAAIHKPMSRASANISVHLGYGTDFTTSISSLKSPKISVLENFSDYSYCTGNLGSAALFSKSEEVIQDCILTQQETEAVFERAEVESTALSRYVLERQVSAAFSGSELELCGACMYASEILGQIPGFTLNMCIFQRPILSTKCLKDCPGNSQSKNSQFSSAFASRAQVFSCIAFFDSGIDADADLFKSALAIASGPAIFIDNRVLCDPFPDPSDAVIRKINANIGNSGIKILLSLRSSRSRLMQPSSSSSKTPLSYEPYDGSLTEFFQNTSMHMSLKSWSIPVMSERDGKFENSCALVDSIISFYDGGKWVADIDLSRTFDMELDGSQITHVTCLDNLDCTYEASYVKGVAVRDWNELLNPPADEVIVIQTSKNWLARLAATAIAAMVGFEVVLLPTKFCWKCCTRAVEQKKEWMKARTPDSLRSHQGRGSGKVAVVLGDDLRYRHSTSATEQAFQGLYVDSTKHLNPERMDVAPQMLSERNSIFKIAEYSDVDIQRDTVAIQNEAGSTISSLQESQEFSCSSSEEDDDLHTGQPLTSFSMNRNNRLRQRADRGIQPHEHPMVEQENLLYAPTAYYDCLRELKASIYDQSALARLGELRSMNYDPDVDPSQWRIPLTSSEILQQLGWMDGRRDKTVLRFCSQLRALHDKELIESLIGIFESRNIIYLAAANLIRLKRSGFISDSFTILVTNSEHRSPSIARSAVVGHSDVMDLACEFQSALSNLARAIAANQRRYEIRRTIVGYESILKRKCTTILEKLGFRFDAALSAASLNYTLALMLDAGIVSYTYAHVESWENVRRADHSPRVTVPQDLDARLPAILTLRRYQTSCLAHFFNGQNLWIFHESKLEIHPPLYVSMDIERFADLWGPCWKAYNSSSQDAIHHYEVSRGSIIPCRPSPSDPPLRLGERLCHYVPKENPWEHDQSQSGDEFSSLPLNGTETLVIGARRKRDYMKWTRCDCNLISLEERLRGQNQLQQLGVKTPYSYVDQRAISVVGGAHGITIGGQFSVKRDSGIFFKDVFFDRWEKQADTRDPAQLANLWGVAISICTSNAERLSVFELLNTPSMHRYLECYQWNSSECQDRYKETVESGNIQAFCSLWHRNRNWQEELGKVISICLQILYHTGLDQERDEFSAFWVTPGTTLPKRVLLKPAEHNWTRLLADTATSFTTAVMVEECLGAKFGRERCGWARGSSALQTSLCINNAVDPSEQLIRREADSRTSSRWEKIWDVSHLKLGSSFLVAPGNRLKTLEILGRTRIILEWDLVWREAIREMMGLQRRSRDSHWEYTEVTEGSIRPVPIYLLSS